MKTFRTVLPPSKAPFSLTHADRIVVIGSCFSEHIGERLRAHKFSVLVNPSGILYNPISIARLLERLLEGEPDISEAIFQHQGLWHSWEHHGRFSHPERETFEHQLRATHQRAAAFAASAQRLLLTLGTAHVFALRQSGRIVANNHKAPAAWFDERRLSVAETVSALATALERWKNARPDLNVVLTVSPVRHLRNGLVENQRSKAVLLLACEQLCAQYPFVHYFPAYELMLDDLRDYRFYAADMTHPSDVAVDYIWEHFSQTFFPPQTAQLVADIARIRAAAAHRPFHPDTPEHRAFAQQQYNAIQQLLQQHPTLDFSEELTHFSALL
ncbi:MAG: GSCFA domain-containing protein [Saprospiraceae bacterium]|nr:GSCFA domain-containing protein [Saprospiraceae bacterium]MDW8230148.1 GSCFA domain-containing protein [Saprospiraceae bacterium]